MAWNNRLFKNLYTFFFCYIRVYSDIVGQIGPAYYTVNDHDMYVYVVFVYACHYNK